jgi:hypothetical protein
MGSQEVYMPKDETFSAFVNTCGDESEKITEMLQARLHLVDFASSDRISTTSKLHKVKDLKDDNNETHHVNLSLLAFGEYIPAKNYIGNKFTTQEKYLAAWLSTPQQNSKCSRINCTNHVT